MRHLLKRAYQWFKNHFAYIMAGVALCMLLIYLISQIASSFRKDAEDERIEFVQQIRTLQQDGVFETRDSFESRIAGAFMPRVVTDLRAREIETPIREIDEELLVVVEDIFGVTALKVYLTEELFKKHVDAIVGIFNQTEELHFFEYEVAGESGNYIGVIDKAGVNCLEQDIQIPIGSNPVYYAMEAPSIGGGLVEIQMPGDSVRAFVLDIAYEEAEDAMSCQLDAVSWAWEVLLTSFEELKSDIIVLYVLSGSETCVAVITETRARTFDFTAGVPEDMQPMTYAQMMLEYRILPTAASNYAYQILNEVGGY